ncbi:MAG TPA: CrcB family protein, partial [Steroidobacteraceae bacterium]|nr:CrcB family protein [Steroidobacteraceae bacterium]
MWKSVLAICIGASLGSLLRWGLGSRLNALVPTLPLGTLAANLIGGYVIGAAVAFFALFATLAP